MQHLINSRIYILLFVFLVSTTGGCRKFVTVAPPKTQLTAEVIFENESTATSAMLGIYTRMVSDLGIVSGGKFSVTCLAGLSADELQSHSSGSLDEFYLNNIDPLNRDLLISVWNDAYQLIYSANAMLEGVENSSNIPEKIKNQLRGEALFVRAFVYYYLVDLFGDIPLATSTDYEMNNGLGRSARPEIYAAIISDLKDAETLLGPSYLDGFNAETSERVRPNSAAASFMLARMSLLNGDWQGAIDYSEKIFADIARYALVENPGEVFLKNSTESVWQLCPSIEGINTKEGELFIIPPGQVPSAVSLTSSLLASFEPGDLRRQNWIDSSVTESGTFWFPFKYKISSAFELSEYPVVLRLGELYLISAEAKAQLGLLEASAADLSAIRTRAGLSPITTPQTIEELLDKILTERRTELFCEWGHRWFDLKRFKQADVILSIEKPLSWTATDTLYPIPHSETLINPKLTQNPGY